LPLMAGSDRCHRWGFIRSGTEKAATHEQTG
jgi:hypothetical protein